MTTHDLSGQDFVRHSAMDYLEIILHLKEKGEVLGLVGRLSRIDLALGPDGPGDLERVRALLPPGVSLGPAGSRATVLDQMTRAFRLNLTMLSLLALLVGVFLIYNTMTFSVVQRRALFGTLRALGATRGEVFAAVQGEALLVGAVGTADGDATGAEVQDTLSAVVRRTRGIKLVEDTFLVDLLTEDLRRRLELGGADRPPSRRRSDARQWHVGRSSKGLTVAGAAAGLAEGRRRPSPHRVPF